MNIFLFGYRGSGKSTIGRLLCEQLRKTFADTDELICRRFDDLTIADIWQTHGEPAFRAAEVEITVQLCKVDEQVVSLGGGTLMQPEARRAVEAAEAVRVYLKCDPQELHRRIAADPRTAADRPSLSSLGGGIEEIRRTLAQREPVYEQVADQVFDVTHLSPQDAVRHLIDRCL
jgi:shikimate kinase